MENYQPEIIFFNIVILIANKIVIVCFNKTRNKQDNKKYTGNYYDYSFILML
jgi:hypothetical protein